MEQKAPTKAIPIPDRIIPIPAKTMGNMIQIPAPMAIPQFTNDGKVILTVTYAEYEEIKYAMKCLKNKRDKSREYAKIRKGNEISNPRKLTLNIL